MHCAPFVIGKKINPFLSRSTSGSAPASNPSLAKQSELAVATVLLQAHRLAFNVGGRSLWRELDLTLGPGERLGITGPSGSGKTLLLRTLAGLEPLQAGELVFDGRSLADWSMPAYRAHVMYVPQRPALREGRVDAALRAPFEFHVHHGKTFPTELASKRLQTLGRDPEFLQQRTERLSGGETQIVAMLRALLVAPDVLLLDEPTASLDADTVGVIEQLITNWLAEQTGRACIWTSHDRVQLERVSDRLLSLAETA